MGIANKSILIFNTIKYLKPTQLFHQAKKRFKQKESFSKYRKQGVTYLEYNLWTDALEMNPQFIKRFNPDGLLKNELTLLNETRFFDAWNYGDASHLWNFNVHYLEYLIPLKAKFIETNNESYKNKINEILTSWYQNGSIEADSNEAYTMSLRIVNQLLIADLVDNKQRLYDSIYAQYRYLINNQEKHLLGNHYFENLKAIVICSLIFKENDVYKRYIRTFLKEIKEEITADGLHFELSLMYHKIILEDLIRVALILKQNQKNEYRIIVKRLKAMCTALYSLEYGLNRTPLFNDAGDNISKPTDALLLACRKLFKIVPRKVDVVSGYYKMYSDKIALIADCGKLAPRYMAGHAHCDCLSFELFYNKSPIFVNSGTYQYQGELRKFFRSTEAHNTVTINDHQQSELWGEHRVARRIARIVARKNDHTLKGIYQNYCDERHQRTIHLNNNELFVLDKTEGKGKSYLHLAPGMTYSDGTVKGNGLVAKISNINASVEIEEYWYSSDFGNKEEAIVLVFSWKRDNEIHGYRIHFYEGEDCK